MRRPSSIRRPLIAGWTTAVAAACVAWAMYMPLDDSSETLPTSESYPLGSTESPSAEGIFLTIPARPLLGTGQFEKPLGTDEMKPVDPQDAYAPDEGQPVVEFPEIADGFRERSLAIVPDQWPSARQKFVIGATAILLEPQSELEFLARVDTGARSCSLHVQEIVIQNEADVMEDNVGKEIRFKVANHEGATHWLQSIVDCCVNVRNSNNVEQRYKVPIAFRWNDFERTVLVTLNNRARMTFPLLLGRNFLEEDFIVDVSLGDDF